MAIKTEAELEAQVVADMPNNGKTKAAKVRDIFQNIIDTLFYWVGLLSTSISDLTTIVNGKANTSHTHAGADITTGIVPVARLGSGTPSSGNFLRGDGSWENVPSNGLITENSAGTEIGTASKMRFSNKFANTWDGANSRITVDIDAASSIQSGDIIFSGSVSTVRNGFLRCNGATVSATTYPNLLLAIGNQFLTNVNIMPALGNPTMTSNTAPAGYIANASTSASIAFQAFNNNAGSRWTSNNWANGTTPPTSGGEWVQLELPTAKIVGRVVITFGANMTTILTGKIQGSNDNTTWDDLAILTSVASGGGATISFPKSYKTYRLLIQTITFGAGSSADIAEIAFFESTQFSLPTTSATTSIGQVQGQIKT